MADVRKMIAEQIGLLVIATVEQQAEIAALRAELEQAKAKPSTASAGSVGLNIEAHKS